MDWNHIKKKSKEYWKRFWHLVWEDESLFGWIVSLLFALIVIKFLFFPALGFILGTSMPLVVVESGSMHHPGSFVLNYFGSERLFEEYWNKSGKWYEERGIYFNESQDWPLGNGMEIGDVIVVVRARNIEIGDIIIFEANQVHPVIHRVVNISQANGATVYGTKGDNNIGQLITEVQIPQDSVIGKAVFRVPVIGWIKLIFVKLLEKFA